jgi:hypothetical protein
MLTGPAADNLVAAVASACRSGLDADALRAAVLPRLRKAVPVDALWWASADPSTLLFTRSYREELPKDSGPYFVENEFLHQDVNKWTELARDSTGVRTLMQATGGQPARSDRYRDIFAPLGLQDGCARCCGSGTRAGVTSACIARRHKYSRGTRRGSCGGSPRTSPKASAWACYARNVTWKMPRTDQVWSCSPRMVP